MASGLASLSKVRTETFVKSFSLRSILGALLLGFLVLQSGCQKHYKSSTIEDKFVVGAELYVLIKNEEGIDRTSHFSDSLAFNPTSRLLQLAKCSVVGTNTARLQVVGNLKLSDERYLRASVFRIWKTNVVIVNTGSNVFEMLRCDSPGVDGTQAEVGAKIEANRIILSSQRHLLLGCGSKSNVMFDRTQPTSVMVNATNALGLLCRESETNKSLQALVSDDASKVTIVKWSGDRQELQIVETAGLGRCGGFGISNYWLFQLKAFFVTPSNNLIFACDAMPSGAKVAVLDERGSVLQSSTMLGDPIVNDVGTCVVAIESRITRQFDARKGLKAMVWHLDTGAIVTIDIDAAELGRTLAIGAGKK